MADDIFLTQEEQDERARKWLKNNGPALAIGIALGLGGIYGWDQYQASQQTKAQRASTLFEQVLQEYSESELSDFDAQFNELKDSFSDTSYAAKAALIKARQLAVTDLDAATEKLQWVIETASESGLRHAARVRLAKIKLRQGEVSAAKTLAQIDSPLGFESHYAEILAEIAVIEDDIATARQEYQRAISTLTPSQAAYARILTIKLDRLPQDEEATTTPPESRPAELTEQTLAEPTQVDASE